MPEFNKKESFKLKYILSAAIHFDDGKKYPNQPANIESGFVVAGFRHADIFLMASILLKLGSCKISNIHEMGFKITQGFLSSEYEFLDRKEAAKVAYNSGQLQEKKGELYSEDIY